MGVKQKILSKVAKSNVLVTYTNNLLIASYNVAKVEENLGLSFDDWCAKVRDYLSDNGEVKGA